MAPPLVRKLPKVTEYVRNVGKSVEYATIDYLKGSMEETSSFVENNQELFRDIAAAAKNYKATLRAADKSIRQSKIYEAGSELKKNLFESIRTGKFYDMDREAEYQARASGSLGDMSDMDDWSFDSNQFDIDSGDMSTEDSTGIISSAVKDATTAQSQVIAKSAEYMAEMNKASTRLLFTQGEKLYSTVSTGLAGTQSMLERINAFLDGPLTTHLNNSTEFYKATTDKLNEITGYIKEMTEMQRNLYKREQAKDQESQYSKVGSSPDLKEYAKQVKKNLMDALPPEAQMLLGDDMGDGSNMLLAFVANPLRYGPDLIARTLVPATIKQSLHVLDASFSNLFTNFIARMNRMAKDDLSDNPIFKFIGKLFGLRTDTKTGIDTSKYEKGPVPFDGITRKAIVDIIPGHLARIEAALTGKTERVYDFETGKWTTIDKIEKSYKDRKKNAVRDATWDVGEDVRDYINYVKKSNEAYAARLQSDYEAITKKIYEDSGVFEPYKAQGHGEDKQNPWDYYGVDKATFMRLAKLMVGSADDVYKGKRKTNAYGLAGNVLDSIEREARYWRDAEKSGVSTYRYLYDESHGSGGTRKTSNANNIIAAATDQYNKNIFWYLRGIYAELSQMRSDGGFGGGSGGRRRRNPKGPSGGGGTTDPRAAFEQRLKDELDSTAKKVETTSTTNKKDDNYKSEEVLDQEFDDWYDAHYGEMPKSASEAFLTQLLKADSLGAKFKVITKNLGELTKKPGLALAGVIDTADKRIFQLVFGSKEGEEIKDKEGNTVRGFLDYLILRTQQTFDKMNDWLDENILNPLKEKLGVESFGELFKRLADKTGLTKAAGFVKDKVQTWTRPTIDRMKAKLGWGASQVKGSLSRTYGAAWNRAKAQFAPAGPTSMRFSDYYKANRGDFNSDDVAAAWQILKENNYSEEAINFVREELGVPDYVLFKAHGGLVTRRGLAVISPGEKVVPVGGRVTQRNNLVAEKAFARRLGLPPGLSYYAAGTGDKTDEEIQKAKETVKKVTSEVMGDTKHKGIANVIASSLLGGGFSLLTGLIGGPLLGAAAGAAFGITQNSGTVQRMLFGEDVVDKDGNPTGQKKGGLISQDLQDKFKKYFPSMKDFGIAGALAGLFTPFGLVGGLMIGSAVGFAKENDQFQEWVFGKKDEKTGERDGGLIKKEFRDKVKKAAPRLLMGAAGGALLGPFGLLGNVVLGSALGFATTTDQFHDAVFGKDDGSGKKKGGLMPAIYRGIVKPLFITGKKFVASANEFIEKHIFGNLKEAVPAMIQMVKNGITGIGDHVKDFLSNMFERTIGRPLSDFLEHTIFDNVRKWMGRLLKAPLALAKGVINAPFAALGFVGKNIRASQIAKGTAGDMTAQQRIDWRNQHRTRMFGKELLGHDAYRNFDNTLAGLQGQEGIDQMKEMRTQLNLYLNTRKELGRQAADLVKQAGEIVSEFFNNTMCADDNTKTVYQAIGSKRIKKIHEAVADGKMDKITSEINWMLREGYLQSGPELSNFLTSMTTLVSKIADIREKQKDTKRAQQRAMGDLSRLSGGTLTNVKNFRRAARLLNTEIDAREAEEAKKRAQDAEAEATPEGQINTTITTSTDRLITKFDTMTHILRNINAYMAMQAGATDVSDILGDTPPGKDLNKLMARRARKLKGKTSENSTVTDDVIHGDRDEAIQKVNEGYHTVETSSGAQGLLDSSGRILPTNSASEVRRDIKEQNSEKKEKKTLRERFNESFFGKFIGGATAILGGAKNGLLGLLGDALNKASPIFNILKWVFLGGTAIAAIGHGSDWLKDKVFPWFKNTVAPWLIGTRNEDGVLVGGIRGAIFGNKTGENGTYEGGIVSGLVNKFSGWWDESPVGKFFTNLWDTWKTEGVIGLVRPVLNWYVTGGEKFYKNILTPLVAAFVEHIPDLAGAIVSGIIQGIKNLFFPGKNKEQEETGYLTTDEGGNVNTTYKVVSTPEGTRYTSSNTSNLGTKLGMNVASSNTIGRTADGQALWVDSNGNTAVKNGNTFVYTDGSGTSTDRDSFSLMKNNSYARFANQSTIAGNVVGGLGNNFIAGLTGLRMGSQTLPMFSKKSIWRSVRKIPSFNLFKTTGNTIAAGTKLGWNAATASGNAATNAGSSLRQKLLNLIGKGTTSSTATNAVDEVAASIAQNGMDVDSILDWNSYFNSAAGAAIGAADDAAGAAANASKTGLLSKIGNAAKSLGSNLTSKLSNTGIGKAVTGAANTVKSKVSGIVNSAKTTVSNVLSKAAGTADDFISKIKGKILTFFDDLAKNTTVMKMFKSAAKILGTTLDDTIVGKALRKVGEKLVEKIGQNVVTSAAKSILNAFAAIPIVAIALAVGYFISGCSNAHNILGVSKEFDIPTHYSIIAGLVNAVKNALPGAGIILSFIPTSALIDLFIDYLLPALGWDDSNLKKMREETQKEIDEMNAELPEEEQVESVEEYNEKTNPSLWQKMKNAVSNFFSGGKSNDEESSSGSGRIESSSTVMRKLRESDRKNKIMMGNRRRGRARHIYQGDPRLENVRFGNSTLGKAGCGPVAAANLMNGNLAYAAQAALPYQTSDGGITPDYFVNTLGGSQTDKKSSMLKAIKKGKPTVLLGKSSRENGTPFGANDHYITAMGMDRNGNIIVEDPDLPGSSYRYPASKVMNDTTTGIITGMRRGFSRRRGFRRLWGFDRATDQSQQVSKLAIKGFEITRQFEGNYSSVNKNDNGSLSIGRIQWHGPRAFDLVRDVINAVGASTAISILGQKLYNEVANGTRTDWNNRTVNQSEADKIGALISTDAGKKIQDDKACIEFDGYLSAGKKKGITDENALCYYADLTNQGGAGGANRVADVAIKLAGSASRVTLDIIHQAALSDKVFKNYAARRNKCYEALKNSKLVGTTGVTTVDSLPASSGSTSTTYTSSSSGNVGVTSQGADAVADMIASNIFGADLISGIRMAQNKQYNTSGVSSIYSSGGTTNVPTNGYGTVGSPTQQGLVDQMASIAGKIKYSLGSTQDPDKGIASCASTVGWAYRKVLGLDDPWMSASSTTQSKDSRFTTIWTNNGSGFNQDSILQPGDVMYYNWDQTKNNGTMQHTEMYAGNGQDWNHGGNPEYGPVLKNLDSTRRKNLMMVRRYNGFIGNDSSGSRRRRGYARTMTSGVSANISSNAKKIISQYGISTGSGTAPVYTEIPTSSDPYTQFLAVIIDLLAAIADNTKSLTAFQNAINNRGANVDYSTLQKAAANARRRSGHGRGQAGYKPTMSTANTFSSADAQDLMNSPTGFMVQAMEALASE